MQKKLVYSAKPGEIIDPEGIKRAVYYGKPKSTVKNFDKYGSREFSEKRRGEIKGVFKTRSLIRNFNNEIREEIDLLKQIKQ